MGGTSSDIDAGAAGMFRADDGTFTVPVGGGADTGAAAVDAFLDNSPVVNISDTNSIPAGNPSGLQSVFASARGEQSGDLIANNVSFSIDKLDDGTGAAIDFEDGAYVVELFFAEISDLSGFDRRAFDVLLEGVTVLNNYEVQEDRAADVAFGSSTIERDSVAAGSFRGLVKRFHVDVQGNDGLQVDLISQGTNHDPILNAVRILRAQPDSPLVAPQVIDVVLRSSEYSPRFGDFAYSSVLWSDSQRASNNSRQIRTAPLVS